VDGARVDGAAVDGAAVDGAQPCTWSAFSTPVLIPNVNSTSTDWTPHLTSDGLTLYFSSDRPGDDTQRIWVATRASTGATFDAPILLASINDGAWTGSPATSVNGLELFYSTGGAISHSTRGTTATPFPIGTEITELSPTESNVGGPFLAADGLTLYYHMGDWNAGTFDMAMATRDTVDGPFTYVKMLNGANSPTENDGWPTVSADHLELYFERATEGGEKIFMATRESVVAPFGLSSLVAEFSSLALSGDPDLSPDGRTMVFAARPTGEVWNLYMSTRTCLP